MVFLLTILLRVICKLRDMICYGRLEEHFGVHNVIDSDILSAVIFRSTEITASEGSSPHPKQIVSLAAEAYTKKVYRK